MSRVGVVFRLRNSKLHLPTHFMLKIQSGYPGIHATKPFNMKNFTLYFARPLVIVSLYIFVCLNSISAQINYNYPIPGPYEDYHGPYFIRVQVNFLQPTNDLWTNNWDVQAEANAVMATLNSAFNKHRIYFVPYTNPCSGSAFQVFTTNLNTLEVRDQLQAPATINEAYHIYVIHDVDGIGGWEFNTPNNFCQIHGKRDGVLVTRSEILVHEVGHNLGLVHTFTGLSNEGCDETPGSCSPNSPCDCCGDYVCDTQPHSNSSINASISCSHPSLPEHIVRNFMSNTNPGDCRNQFTSEQAKRMRTYLELAPVLQSAQIKTTNYPGTIPSSFSGNIIVHSGELLVNSQINMLPGSTIRVKRGAKLRISSTITAACNGMWQGVIVEGSTFATQTAANQGSVVISTNGKIEHAKIAIDVQDSDPISKPIPSSGGGIVTVVGGQFVNNTIGIRFGAYATPGTGAANSSLLVSGRFSITDEYRDGNNKTTFLDLTGIVRLIIIGGRFQDLRTQCTDTSNRALGIDSKNAGFSVSSARFEGLDIGVHADKLDKNNGSFTVRGNTFIGCYKDVLSQSTSGFSIVGNTFNIQKPDPCPSSATEIVGVQIKGTTAGFRFSDNTFAFTGNDTPTELLIGTDCQSLGEGLANTIEDNSYSHLNIGNRANGINSGNDDGLLYQCNTNANDLLGAVLLFPRDFQINGPIRKIQAGLNANTQNPDIPTGNVFSNVGHTFENLGTSVDYYYDANDPLQNPNVGQGSLGINEEDLVSPNLDCGEQEPCDPCPKAIVDEWKEDFYENQAEWTIKKALLPTLTNQVAIEQTKSAIHKLRLAMNRDGGRVLRNLEQDTVSIQVDSILHWLALLQTYQTDLQLAKHHFFTGNSAEFVQTWHRLETEHDLTGEQEAELNRLGEVFDMLENELSQGFTLNNLPESSIENLILKTQICDEAAFLSEILLWRNGIRVETNCSGNGERSKPNGHIIAETVTPIQLLPNPVDNLLTIKFEESSTGNLQITNQYGRIIYTSDIFAQNEALIINTAAYSSGIYFVVFRIDGGLPQFCKFIVKH